MLCGFLKKQKYKKFKKTSSNPLTSPSLSAQRAAHLNLIPFLSFNPQPKFFRGPPPLSFLFQPSAFFSPSPAASTGPTAPSLSHAVADRWGPPVRRIPYL
jgi:hypothetical protein